MNLWLYLFHGWNANPVVIVALVVAGAAYVLAVGRRGRPAWFVAALALAAGALLSPINLLASGVLFSAHMAQHIMLLLLVPALVLASLPVAPSKAPASHRRTGALALGGWALGVGSMWFWHVPQLCNAAAGNPTVHAGQTLSLLGMGAVFWWPILGPRTEQRLAPGHGIVYLFSACLACTGLGILLTLSTVDICPIFRAPTTAPAMWTALRDELTPARDQQIGGLLMWMPMCLVYVGAIVLELARWLGQPATTPAASPDSAS